MRKKIVAGNWKMNLLTDDANQLISLLKDNKNEDVELIVFPSYIFLPSVIKSKGDKLMVGAQNFYPKDKGAFTGEISVSQLSDIGVTHVLIGHSERRAYFGEDESFLKQKVDVALENTLTPVFCCGEPLEIRDRGEEFSYVKQQLIDSLFHLSIQNIEKCIIAYEPVWAIGTGKTATIEQAEEMHKEIRNWLTEVYGNETAQSISILYGGSCNAANAKELFACENVDGGLIGGAALDSDAFLTISNSF